ncbi:hypothetical protein FA15DRAFT_662452 [Coprinopsis marcescibilis]|uniref:Uncharacterized protein n=1 Tax=Coprinopsis marcescibilis TaxID=230819 RepID=A0A5C3LCG5_COPMA|nr:hypothetical protein FA15DRAFT_662452 [Coprinopsis marcescibilis]
MYPLTTSTTSLVFPGHYPATPARSKLGVGGILELPKEDVPKVPCLENDCQVTTRSPVLRDAPDSGAYSPSSKDHTCLEYFTHSGCSPRSSVASVYPASDEESSGPDSLVSSVVSRQHTFGHGNDSSSHFTSTVSIASVAVASTSRSNVSSFGRTTPPSTDPRATERFVYGFSSSLSLEVNLLGLPALHQQIGDNEGEGEDNESLCCFAVDLSCLSQPDGRNSWTLGLGPPSVIHEESEAQIIPEFCTSSAVAGFWKGECAASISSQGETTSDDLPAWLVPFGPTNPGEAPTSEQCPIAEDLPLSQKPASRPRQVIKGLLGDVKRFGKKVKGHLLRTQKQDTSPTPNDTLSEQKRCRRHSSYIPPQPLGFREPGFVIPFPDTTNSPLNSRPPTPPTSFAFSMMSSDVKDARRRSLPPVYSASPFTSESRRSRPASLILPAVNAPFEFRKHSSMMHPLAQEFSLQADLNDCQEAPGELGSWRETPATANQKRSRWSTFSFMNRR